MTFQGAHNINWPLVMAGTVMSQLPMLVIFIFAQRWFVQSLATGCKVAMATQGIEMATQVDS